MKTLLLIMSLVFCSLCSAQDITIWLPSSPGGISTKNALLLRQLLEQRTKKTVVINNVPGAGGLIGLQKFMTQKDNRIHLFLNNEKPILDTYFTGQLNSTVLELLKPIANLGHSQYILSTSVNNSLNSIEDLIRSQRRNTIGNLGRGSMGHLIQLSLEQYLQQPLVSVYYKGTSQAVQDLIGGHIDLYSIWEVDGIEFVRAGRLRPLAASGVIQGLEKPVRTFRELGLDMPRGTFFAIYTNPYIQPSDLDFVQKTLLEIFNTEYTTWMQTLLVTKPSGDPAVVSSWYSERMRYYQRLSKDPKYASMKETD